MPRGGTLGGWVLAACRGHAVPRADACEHDRVAKRLGRAVLSRCHQNDSSSDVDLGSPGGVDGEWPRAGSGSQPRADTHTGEQQRRGRPADVWRPRSIGQ